MRKITPFLWFDGKAEEAMNHYVSIFGSSAVESVTRLPDGTVMAVSFELEGQHFLGLNGGPMYEFTPAVSFLISCDSQEEIDHYWNRLLEGGTPSRCGWLTDKFGVSWQVVPRVLGELMSDPDPARSGRTMQAMMQMVKFDIAALIAAADGP